MQYNSGIISMIFLTNAAAAMRVLSLSTLADGMLLILCESWHWAVLLLCLKIRLLME